MSELTHPESEEAAPGLTDLERSILDFEGRWREHVGAKEEAIREQLELTPSRYYQLLGRLLDGREALEYDPMLVKRLRRIRDQRSALRAERERALTR